MKTISRYIMTLALLLTAVTGAWAQSTLNVVELEVPAAWEGDNSYMTAADLTGFKASTKDEAQAWTGAPAGVGAYLFYAFDGDIASYVYFDEGKYAGYNSLALSKALIFGTSNTKFFYTTGTAEAPITVKPGSSANTWTFSMPGSDVVLTPIYANAATFATTGSEPEVKTLLPEAAEGVIAGTDAPLIAEGTGIVAFAGTSTEVTQGTLMYAIGTSATEAPALTDFSATVPTAKNVDDDGADVYVWYYIQGADAPEGVAATLDNTFNNTEPACLTVTVLTNKFDIQFNAANANTIEAGKATVTVGGTAATVTEGKLQGVKMGSEVKLEAKPGYKFRKVEVKKKEALIVNPVVGQVIGSDGKNYDANATLPDGVKAVAMIAYVGSETGVEGYTNGLALALSDKGSMDWTTATGASGAAASTPAAPTPMTSSWMLPSKDQWKKMIDACKNVLGTNNSYQDLRDGFSGIAGANNMQSGDYWSSTEQGSLNAWLYYFSSGIWNTRGKDSADHVRACLAF